MAKITFIEESDGTRYETEAENGATVNWGANANPAGTVYRVEISSVAGFTAGVLSNDTAALSAAFTGLRPNTTYFGRVKAMGYNGL